MRAGFSHPTIIQSAVLPVALTGRDVLVRAKTGSGKTVSYVLPLLQKVLSRNHSNSVGMRALILVPTRELCAQVFKQCRALMSYCSDDVSILSLGSDSKDTQVLRLRESPDIVVATPGVLLGHIRSGCVENERARWRNGFNELNKHLRLLKQFYLAQARRGTRHRRGRSHSVVWSFFRYESNCEKHAKSLSDFANVSYPLP